MVPLYVHTDWCVIATSWWYKETLQGCLTPGLLICYLMHTVMLCITLLCVKSEQKVVKTCKKRSQKGWTFSARNFQRGTSDPPASVGVVNCPVAVVYCPDRSCELSMQDLLLHRWRSLYCTHYHSLSLTITHYHSQSLHYRYKLQLWTLVHNLVHN